MKFALFDIVKHRNGGVRYVVKAFKGEGTGLVLCKDTMTGAEVEYHYTLLKKVA